MNLKKHKAIRGAEYNGINVSDEYITFSATAAAKLPPKGERVDVFYDKDDAAIVFRAGNTYHITGSIKKKTKQLHVRNLPMPRGRYYPRVVDGEVVYFCSREDKD